MAEARQREMWNHTASLLAVLINVNRDPKRSRPVKPAEIHPFTQRQKVVARVGIEALKQVFVD